MGPNLVLKLMLGAALVSYTACKAPDPVLQDRPDDQIVADGSIPDDWFASTGLVGDVGDDWLGTFEDEQLVALVEEALEHNHDLAIAANGVQAASGLATIAGAALKPTIALGGGGLTGQALGQRGELGAIGAGISWELDLWGRVSAAAQAAGADYRASEAELLFAREAMAGLIARLWFQTAEAVLLQRTVARTVEIRTQLLVLTELRRSKGAADDQAVHLARSAVASGREGLLAAENSVRELRRALEITLGRFPAAEIEILTDLPPMPAPIPAGLPSELLERRYDLLAAEYRVAAAFHRLHEARVAHLPRIGLSAGGGRSSGGLGDLLGQPNFFGAGAGFLAPIYTGGALEAQTEIRTVQQEAALTAYGRVALRAFHDVETGLDREQSLAERHAAATLQLTEQRETTRIERARFEAGRSDMLRVLQLENLEVLASLSEIHIRSLRLTNRVDLYLALGGNARAAAPESDPAEAETSDSGTGSDE